MCKGWERAQQEFADDLPKHTAQISLHHHFIINWHTLSSFCCVLRAKKMNKFHRYIFLLILSFTPTVQSIWKVFTVCSLVFCVPLCPPAVGPLFSLLTVICVIRQARLGNLLCSANQSQSSILLHIHTDTHIHNFSMLTKLIGKHSCARSHRNTNKTHCSNWHSNICMGN